MTPSKAPRLQISRLSAGKKNLLAYYFNFATVAIVGLAVNPLLLGALGATSFGLLKSTQRYLDFASVADGRSAQALKWIVANRSAEDAIDRKRDIAAALIVWLACLPVLIALATLITLTVPTLIAGFPADMRAVLNVTAALLAGNLVLSGLLSIPDSVLVGVNLGYRSMLVTTVATVLANIGMVVSAMAGAGMVGVALSVLVGAAVNGVATYFLAKRDVPWFGVAKPSAADIRRVFGFSAWTLGWTAIEKLYLSAELILVGLLVGAVGVAHYTFTAYALQFILVIGLITASGYMPSVGILLGRGDQKAASDVVANVRRNVIVVVMLMCAFTFAFNGTFVRVWAGPAQYMGDSVNALLVLLTLQLCLVRLDSQILDSALRMQGKVIVGSLAALLSLGAGVVAYGLSGTLEVALIAVIAVRLLASVVFPLLVRRALPFAGYPTPSLILGFVLCSLSYLVSTMVSAGLPVSQIALMVSIWSVLMVIYAFWGLRFSPRRVNPFTRLLGQSRRSNE